MVKVSDYPSWQFEVDGLHPTYGDVEAALHYAKENVGDWGVGVNVFAFPAGSNRSHPDCVTVARVQHDGRIDITFKGSGFISTYNPPPPVFEHGEGEED